MKNFVLAVAVALLALAAVPASAGEISEAAFLTTLAQQAEPVPSSTNVVIIRQSCDLLNGTVCPSVGATTTCRDVCGYQVSCVCTTYAGNLRYWRCGWQC